MVSWHYGILWYLGTKAPCGILALSKLWYLGTKAPYGILALRHPVVSLNYGALFYHGTNASCAILAQRHRHLLHLDIQVLWYLSIQALCHLI